MGLNALISMSTALGGGHCLVALSAASEGAAAPQPALLQLPGEVMSRAWSQSAVLDKLNYSCQHGDQRGWVAWGSGRGAPCPARPFPWAQLCSGVLPRQPPLWPGLPQSCEWAETARPEQLVPTLSFLIFLCFFVPGGARLGSRHVCWWVSPRSNGPW